MSRPAYITIDCSALSHNICIVKRIAPFSKIWAVAKANAYGHGLANIYSSLDNADGCALLDLDDAVLLRKLGWKKPILMLEGFFEPDELKTIAHYQLSVVVYNEEQLRMIEVASRNNILLPSSLCVYLKMNTGMNRLGFCSENYLNAWHRAFAIPAVNSITLMTHFATADNLFGTAKQFNTFNRIVARLPGERCLANSAAILWHRHTHAHWIRPGIILYGASPSGDHKAITSLGLKNVMTLSSKIIAVQTLNKGQAIGYGATFTASSPTRIGIVACGYADGYPQQANNGTPIVVDGVLTRLIGRVSMDMLTVDLTPCPHANIGSSVELWGKQIAVDDVATASGNIGYELLCAVMPRLKVKVIK